MHALNDPRVLLRIDVRSVVQKSHKLAMRPQNGVTDYECIKIKPSQRTRTASWTPHIYAFHWFMA